MRSATFDDPEKPYGAILGEITADRGSFAVRTTDQVVIGIITPDLVIEGWDEGCAPDLNARFVQAQEGTYVTLVGDRPVGTIEGRFPRNGFGVQ